MGLLSTTSEIREHASINKNYHFDSLKRFVKIATAEYIIPLIGEEQYEDILAKYEAETTSGKDLKLLELLQGALANYTLFEAAPHINVHVSEMGIQQSYVDDADTSRPATNQAVNKIELSYQKQGYRYADLALKYLEKNADDFPIWVASEAFTQTRDLFIRNKTEFSRFNTSLSSLKTYQAFRPYLKNTENFKIRPVLGATEFDSLKQALQDEIKLDSPLSAMQRQLLEKIQPALAYWGIAEGLNFIQVEIIGDGLYIREFQAGNRSVADGKRIENLRQSTRGNSRNLH